MNGRMRIRAVDVARELTTSFPDHLSWSRDTEGRIWVWAYPQAGAPDAAYQRCIALFGAPQYDDGYPVWMVPEDGEG